jgi:NADH-quinone oxidoreductase subunit N
LRASSESFISSWPSWTGSGSGWSSLAGLNSVVSLYYYFRVVKVMFFSRPPEGTDPAPLRLHWLQYVVLASMAVPTLVFGLYFGPLKDLCDAGIRAMAGG